MVDKRNFIIRCFFICLILLFFTIVIMVGNKEAEVYEKSTIIITVKPNDTLWRIAEEYKNDSQDIREYVNLIKDMNNIEDSMIYEGQKLEIIKYEKIN